MQNPEVVDPVASRRRKTLLWIPEWGSGLRTPGRVAAGSTFSCRRLIAPPWSVSLRCRPASTSSGWVLAAAGVGGPGGEGGGSGTYFLCENCDVLQMTDAGPQWSAGERSCRMEGTFSTAMAASSAGMGAASRCEGAAAAWREPVQLLREPIVLRDSSHAEGAGGAVCATVVGIARTRWESAWSP